MTRRHWIVGTALLAAASAPAQPAATPLDDALKTAQAEQKLAERRAAELERAAAQARNKAGKLRAEQAAAAQAIDTAEAKITAADVELRLIAANLDLRRRQLAIQQQPVAALLAGLVVMGQRPPLLVIADSRSTDEIVAVRTLVDATLPVIRRRTAALSSELRAGESLRKAAIRARGQLADSRRDLVSQQRRFAALELQAAEAAATASVSALASGDRAIRASEDVDRLQSSSARSLSARALAEALAAEGAAPPGPEGAAVAQPRGLQYRLPATSPVIDGIGSVSSSGVRSRGITLATVRGSAVFVPASGVVRFSGPFKEHDGIAIIDHGGGWMSLIVGVSSPHRPGDRVELGEPLGRALGPIGVELSQNGRRVSPALIAGSSQSLSKAGKGG